MLLAMGELALSMILVGANVVVVKVLAEHLPVFVILVMRTSIAALVLAPFAGIVRLPPRRVMLYIVLQATLGTIGYNAFLIAGLARTGALQAGLILASLPAVIALGAALWFREKLGLRRWIAILLAGLGMGALAHGKSGAFSIIGDILIFAGVCGEAGYALIAKRVAGRLPPLTATFWMQASGAVLAAPVAAATWPSHGFSAFVIGLLILHSLSTSVAAVLLCLRASLSQMDVPTRNAYVMALVPAEDRTEAASTTGLARLLARPLGPLLAGGAESLALGAPFLISGVLKGVYDVGLWLWFRRVPLPAGDERPAVPAMRAEEATT